MLTSVFVPSDKSCLGDTLQVADRVEGADLLEAALAAGQGSEDDEVRLSSSSSERSSSEGEEEEEESGEGEGEEEEEDNNSGSGKGPNGQSGKYLLTEKKWTNCVCQRGLPWHAHQCPVLMAVGGKLSVYAIEVIVNTSDAVWIFVCTGVASCFVA